MRTSPFPRRCPCRTREGRCRRRDRRASPAPAGFPADANCRPARGAFRRRTRRDRGGASWSHRALDRSMIVPMSLRVPTVTMLVVSGPRRKRSAAPQMPMAIRTSPTHRSPHAERRSIGSAWRSSSAMTATPNTPAVWPSPHRTPVRQACFFRRRHTVRSRRDDPVPTARERSRREIRQTRVSSIHLAPRCPDNVDASPRHRGEYHRRQGRHALQVIAVLHQSR